MEIASNNAGQPSKLVALVFRHSVEATVPLSLGSHLTEQEASGYGSEGLDLSQSQMRERGEDLHPWGLKPSPVPP